LSVTGQAGAYQKELRVSVTLYQNNQVVILTGKFENAVLDLQISVSRSGEINGFYIKPSKTSLSSRPQTPKGPFPYARQEVVYTLLLYFTNNKGTIISAKKGAVIDAQY
jgi:hypothetical protein